MNPSPEQLQRARDAGFTDEQIQAHIAEKQELAANPRQPTIRETLSYWGKATERDKDIARRAKSYNLKINQAFDAGYDEEAVFEHLASKPHFQQTVSDLRRQGLSDEEIYAELTGKPVEEVQRSLVERGVRLPLFVALGRLQSKTMPYDISMWPQASKEAQNVALRENLQDDVDRLRQYEAMGVADEEDLILLRDLEQKLEDPRRTLKDAQAKDLTTRALIENLTGLELKAETPLEHAANWYGFIKDSDKIIAGTRLILSGGLSPQQIIKAAVPGKDLLRSLGAGTALHMAEENQLGPIGTLAAAIIGDVAGLGVTDAARYLQSPKAAFAKSVGAMGKKANSTKAWKQDLVKAAKDFDIPLDAGTLTDSNIVKFLQTKAMQSSFSGEHIENLRKNMSDSIMREYQKIAEQAGPIRYASNDQAASAIREYIERFGPRIEEPSVEGFLNTIHPEPFETTYQSGESIKTTAEEIRAPIKKQFQDRYSDIANEVAPLKASQKELAEELTKFIKDNAGTFLPGEAAAESKVLASARKLRNQLVEEALLPKLRKVSPELGKYIEERMAMGDTPEQAAALAIATKVKEVTKAQEALGASIFDIAENVARLGSENAYPEVSLRSLMKTKTTLGDLADWEFAGSNFRTKYKKLYGEVNKAAKESIGRVNADLGEALRALDAEYTEFKRVFEDKNLKDVFTPNNRNYVKIASKFERDPDALRALERVLGETEAGQDVLSKVKRDFADRIMRKKDLTDRDIANLKKELGAGYDDIVDNFLAARKEAREAIPRAKKGEPLTAEYLREKSADQIMTMMDTVEGIRKLKSNLGNTAEGRELFEELARYKVERMIGDKMFDSAKQQLRFNKFSKLASNPAEKAILRELLGSKGLERFQKLQRLSGQLNESAQKFFNASQTQASYKDMAILSGGLAGIFSFNPWLIMSSLTSGMSINMFARLISDPEVLKIIEEEMMRPKQLSLQRFAQRMTPYVNPDQVRTVALDEEEQ